MEDAVDLNPIKRDRIAHRIDEEARTIGDSPADAQVFLDKWRRAQRVLYRAGMVHGNHHEEADLLWTLQNYTVANGP